MPQPINLGIEFQRALVKLAVLDQDWLSVNREFFLPEGFDSPELNRIVSRINTFYDEHEVAPEPRVVIDMIKKAEQGEFRKMVLVEFDTVADVDLSPSLILHATESLHNFSRRQVYKDTIINGAGLLDAGDFDGIRGLFDKAVNFGDRRDTDSVFYFDESAIKERTSHNQELDTVPTLFSFLDRKGSAPARKELWVLMGPTGVGKSIALVNLASAALFQGFNVLHITAEMSAQKTSFRYDLRLTGMTHDERQANPDKFMGKLLKFRGLYKGNLIIKEYPAREASVLDVRAYIKLLARRHGFKVDLLIVDPLDELKRPKAEKDYISIGHVTAGLHATAKRENLLCWTATNTNRAGFIKARITLDDIGESWEKAKIADGVIGISQTDEEHESEPPVQRWYELKKRDSRRISKPMWVETRFEKMFIKEMTK